MLGVHVSNHLFAKYLFPFTSVLIIEEEKYSFIVFGEADCVENILSMYNLFLQPSNKIAVSVASDNRNRHCMFSNFSAQFNAAVVTRRRLLLKCIEGKQATTLIHKGLCWWANS